MTNEKRLILGIETSCDETSAAVYDTKNGLLSNVVASQIDIHKKTGGVVPEVASRMHVEVVLPVIDQALEMGGVDINDINYLAVTFAPGLIGSLLVGVNTAKALAMILDKPLLPVNHLEGHIYANFINEIRISTKSQVPNPKQISKLQITNKSKISNPDNLNGPKNPNNPKFNFPAIVLLVSGGHTSLILMKNHGEYKYLGETLDDAAGEAFDKVAKVLDMEYPGGPNVSKAADAYRQKLQISNNKLQTNFKSQIPKLGSGRFFPRSMLDSKDFNFSFSGLKTSVLYKWQDVTKGISDNSRKLATIREEFSYEFEEAVVDILATKTIQAAEKYKAKTVSVCGGVAANKRLREEIGLRVQNLQCTAYNLPPLQYCGDNAAMIAACASYKIKKIKKEKTKKLRNLDFEVLSNKFL